MRGSQRRLFSVQPRLRRLGRRRQRQRPEPRGHHRPWRQRHSRAESQHQRPAAAMAWSPRSGSAPRALRRPPVRALCACASLPSPGPSAPTLTHNRSRRDLLAPPPVSGPQMPASVWCWLGRLCRGRARLHLDKHCDPSHSDTCSRSVRRHHERHAPTPTLTCWDHVGQCERLVPAACRRESNF